jgi:hypothetical protein
MSPCIALNNSPYYYYHPRMAASIGWPAPTTGRVVTSLARHIARVSLSFGEAYVPGIQFGVESDRALQNASLQRRLVALREKLGLCYIVHIPDLVVPGAYHPSGVMTRIARLWYGRASSSPEAFGRFMRKRIRSAAAIGAPFMVLHLPNGPREDPQETARYFSSDMASELERAGILLGIENCNSSGSPYYGEIAHVHSLIESLDGPYGFCFDYGHYRVGRTDVDGHELARAATAPIHHVHINDGTADQHLFLGERPSGADHAALDRVEERYVREVLSHSRAPVYVLERNKPFSPAMLSRGVGLLIDAIGPDGKDKPLGR